MYIVRARACSLIVIIYCSECARLRIVSHFMREFNKFNYIHFELLDYIYFPNRLIQWTRSSKDLFLFLFPLMLLSAGISHAH